MNYSEQNDETLVSLVLAGNHHAYEGLVLHHEHRVLNAAYAVTQNHHMAEDAAQDAFVTAFIKLNLLHDPSKYGVWICRIAQNCARNMLVRVREYVGLEFIENCLPSSMNVEDAFIASEENETLHESVARLPEKAREVIRLHYFEDLPVAEIAERLRIPVGTVKWQLHEGRRKLRKELGAVNEKENDRLVVKVMKKVEELKLWRLKNNKDGFETVYEDVLREVEALPESEDKHRFLSDTLAHGVWWIPGKKSEEMLARIKESALIGKNEEIMEYVLAVEENRVPKRERVDFVKNTQIPFLEQHGLTHCLGREWFWLAYGYFRAGQPDDGFAALNKTLSLLNPADTYYANALAAQRIEETRLQELSDLESSAYNLLAIAEEYRYINGELRFWNQPGYGTGNLQSVFFTSNYVFYNAFRCDSRARIPNAAVGDSITASDGYLLTFEAQGVTVETPCGVFTDCEVWTGKGDFRTYKTYFKNGIGIVRQEITDCFSHTDCLLSRYHIAGGGGMFPCHTDNYWEYALADLPQKLEHRLCSTITYADDKKVIFSHHARHIRRGYDETNWHDTLLQLRSEYVRVTNDGEEILVDVSPVMARAEMLANTPYRRTHTDIACRVMRRILETDKVFNPHRTHSGHWNFFQVYGVLQSEKQLMLDDGERLFSFEWKAATRGVGDIGYPVFYNHLLTILSDSVGCLWSEDWLIDHPQTKNGRCGGCRTRTTHCLHKAGTVHTAAGSFDDCVTLDIEVAGLSGGLGYRGGKMAYTFAPGIGIVRVTHNYKNDMLQAVYELTSYRGIGEGYMPIFPGMVRHYDALGLTDGYIGSAEYTCERNENGVLTLFTDLCGIRELTDTTE